MARTYRRFYFASLAALLALSAYPLISGTRMVYLVAAQGAIEPAQYAKYVVPYAAVCFSALLFAALQPLLLRLGRPAFPLGLVVALAAFAAIELFLERLPIGTDGLVQFVPFKLTLGNLQDHPTATVASWQLSLCAISPAMLGQAAVYESGDMKLYVVGNIAYRLHYFLIAIALIAMVCGLVFRAGRALRAGGRAITRPILLQGASTAALIALCAFANATAFFRKPEPIQTPLASLLTCAFFVGLGASVGVYAGSLAPWRSGRMRLAWPALVASATVALFYLAELTMMAGNPYRFGIGWFFVALPRLALAPVDILVVLLSGVITWLILLVAMKGESSHPA